MRAIIKGKEYDTEESTLIVKWSKVLSTRCCEESLYESKRGDFFIVKFGQIARRGGWDERIIPCTNRKANEWLEGYYDYKKLILNLMS